MKNIRSLCIRFNLLKDRDKSVWDILHSLDKKKYNGNNFDIAVKNRERNLEKLKEIKVEKQAAAACYKTYLDIMESDYDRLLKQEKIKREIELYRQGYVISQDGKPYKDFKETVLRMAKWAEMVQEKAARSKLQERHYRSR